MSRTVPETIQGLILMDPAFGASLVNASLSTATSADPRPGITENTNDSAMELEQGGESWGGETLTLTALQNGTATAGPGAARVLWSGEAAFSGTEQRGWLPFSMATDWHRLSSPATLDTGLYPGIGTPSNPHAIRLSNGDILIAFQHTSGGTDYLGVVRYDAEIGRYDPSFATGAGPYTYSARTAYVWTADAVSENDLNSATPTHPCLVELPSGKLILFFISLQSQRGGTTVYTVGMAISSDQGASWTVASTISDAQVANTDIPYGLQVAWHGGYLTCVINHDLAGVNSSFTQFYSASEGANWTAIDDDDEAGPTYYWSAQAVGCDDGTCLILYIRQPNAGTITITAGRKLIPSQAVKATGIELEPIGASTTGYEPGQNRLAACMGPERTLHLLAVVADTGSASERLRYARFPQSVSAQSQVILLPAPGDPVEGEPIDYLDGIGGPQHPYARSCCIFGERLLLLWDAVAGTSGTVFQLFGGFSSIDWNGPTFGKWNSGVTTTQFGVWWDATYVPSAIAGWTTAGAGTESSSTETALRLDFSGGASTKTYTRTGLAGQPAAAWVRRRQESGGSLTTNDAIVNLRAANGTFDYDITVRFTTTGARMVDNNNAGATVGTDISGLTASQTMDFLISLTTTGRAVCWYKVANSQVWLQGPTGNATNDGATPAATPMIVWGHSNSSTQVSAWLLVGSWLDGYGALPASITEPNQDQLIFGREVSLYPGYLSDGRMVRASSSPALKGESWALAPAFDYPLSNLDPTIEPSPNVSWRSQDDQVEQILAWEFSGAYQSLSPALGLYLRGANFLSLVWERWNGAAWVSVASLSTVAVSGAFSRSGYHLTPTAAVGSIAVSRNELAGAWVVLTSGGLNHYRKLAANHPGVWSNGADDLQAVLQLEGDLTGLPTSGDLQVIAPELSHVVNVGGIGSTRWRILIPARTWSSSSESYQTASVLLVGPYVPFGQKPSWGRTMGLEPQQILSTAQNGRTRVQQLAPRGKRTAEIALTDSNLAYDIYYGTISEGQANTVGLASSGLPNAFAHDPRMVEDLLLAAQGALYPVVYLPALTPPGGTIVRRDLQLYGRIVNPTLRTAPLGTPGSQEVQIPSAIRIEELV